MSPKSKQQERLQKKFNASVTSKLLVHLLKQNHEQERFQKRVQTKLKLEIAALQQKYDSLKEKVKKHRVLMEEWKQHGEKVDRYLERKIAWIQDVYQNQQESESEEEDEVDDADTSSD